MTTTSAHMRKWKWKRERKRNSNSAAAIACSMALLMAVPAWLAVGCGSTGDSRDELNRREETSPDDWPPKQPGEVVVGFAVVERGASSLDEEKRNEIFADLARDAEAQAEADAKAQAARIIGAYFSELPFEMPQSEASVLADYLSLGFDSVPAQVADESRGDETAVRAVTLQTKALARISIAELAHVVHVHLLANAPGGADVPDESTVRAALSRLHAGIVNAPTE